MTIVSIIGWSVLALIVFIVCLGAYGYWSYTRDVAEIYRDSDES